MNLNDLDQSLEDITFPTRLGGRTYPVLPADGIAIELLLELRAKEAVEAGSGAGLVWKIAARCMPAAPPSEVQGLTGKECWAIIHHASGGVRAVEAEQPRPPAAAASTPRPDTPSGPSAGV